MIANYHTHTCRCGHAEGVAVILGSDAHRPAQVADPKSEQAALALAERLGLPVMDRLSLRLIFSDPGTV